MTTRDEAGVGTRDAPIPEEEQQELIEELERKRTPRGATAVAVTVVAILFSAFQMWLAARGFVFRVDLPVVGRFELAALQLLQVNAVHVCFALVLAFLLFPPTTGDGFLSRRLGRVVPGVRQRFGGESPVTRASEGARGVVRWLFMDPERRRVTPADAVLVLLSFFTGSYMITDFDEIRQMRALGLQAGRTVDEVYPFLDPVIDALGVFGLPLTEVSYAFVLGAIGVLLVLEATRRALGLYLMLIVTSFIVYARWGYLIPVDAPYVGVLSITPLSWDAIVQNLWYNTENGVFGIPVTVSVRFIYIFILFGAFLEMSGAGKWFIDLAYSATGERKGGPAKASIIASGFMGTISGSSIANTVTTGAFTIPLMKRSGYSPEFSGAVEASASSGGQILPPVMGAAAFLIVEYTLTPFRDVIVAAAIPAIVFFFGVWVMVHLEASKRNIGGLAPEDLVAWRPHMLRGWFYLVPLFLLLYYLIIARLSVARSAWFTLIAIGALIALPVLAIGSLQLPETEPKTPDQTLRGHVNPTQIYGLVRPSILYTTVLAGICTFVWQSILSFFPTFLIEFKGISSVTASTMFGAIFVAVAVSAPISGNLSDKFGRDAVLALLMTIGAAGFATIVLVGSRLGAYIGILTIGIGMSWPGPVQSRYMDRFSEEEQGIGFGFVRTGYMLIGSMGSVVTGTIAESMGWISAYGLLGVLLFFLFALIAVNRILGLEL
jgi:TRAP-type uncharacterized transport system fused permease subunit